MSMSNSISRLTNYYRRHGFIDTVRRAGLAAKRAVFSSRMVVYYCDLGTQSGVPVNLPNLLRVERVISHAGLSQQDYLAMTSFWNPKLAQSNIQERFEKGASLWLIKSGDKLAGYGWTLQGCTIEPYYFPLGQDDVHLFDFHIFPEYRGRGMNPLLVTYILRNLATNRGGRAFIEAAQWNDAQLGSLQKTPFRRLGLVWSFTTFGHTYVSWLKKETSEQLHGGVEKQDGALTVAKPHE